MAQAIEKAVYYNTNLDGKVFEVLKRNKDGTVDIGTGDKVVVKGCPIAKEARHGYATLGETPAEPASEKPETAGQKTEELKAAK